MSYDFYESKSPDNIPDIRVAKIGVCVLVFTLAKHLKSNPSSAMAYNIRGKGNIDPSKLKPYYGVLFLEVHIRIFSA